MDNKKKCPKCGKARLLKFFGKCLRRKDGLAYWCKFCKREWHKTPAGRKSHKKYDRSSKRKEALKRWYTSPAGKKSIILTQTRDRLKKALKMRGLPLKNGYSDSYGVEVKRGCDWCSPEQFRRFAYNERIFGLLTTIQRADSHDALDAGKYQNRTILEDLQYLDPSGELLKLWDKLKRQF